MLSSRTRRILALTVVPAAALLFPVDLDVGTTGASAGVRISSACAFPSCAPKPDWDCVHDTNPPIIIRDKCDPNDTGCTEPE